MRIVSIVVGFALASTSAAASPFVNIHRFDRSSSAGGEITYVDNDPRPELFRFDAHAQYVDAQRGAGVYLQIPFSFASGEGYDEFTRADIEVGGLYVPRLSAAMAIALHGGLTLPTASADDARFASLAGGIVRVHDIYQTLPSGTTLRLGASPLYQQGSFFARVDFGIDINLHRADDYDSTETEREEPAIHVNAGAGFHVSPELALTLELSTITFFGDRRDTLANGIVGGRYQVSGLAPYAGIIVPLADTSRNLLDLGVTLGIDVPL